MQKDITTIDNKERTSFDVYEISTFINERILGIIIFEETISQRNDLK